jgi:hypothetical protein
MKYQIDKLWLFMGISNFLFSIAFIVQNAPAWETAFWIAFCSGSFALCLKEEGR